MGTQRLGRAAGALGVILCLLGGARGAAAQGIDTSGFAGEVFQLLNQQRAANGLPALHGSAALDSSAQAYAEAMKQATAGGPVFLSHTGPDGSTFQGRISSAGYNDWTTIGENIAAGQTSPQDVVDAWMNSPGHRENILDPAFRDIGIGIAVGPGAWPGGYKDPSVIWWVTDFGNSRDSSSTGSNPTPPVSPPPPSPPSSLPAVNPPSSPPTSSPTLNPTPPTSPTGSTPPAASNPSPSPGTTLAPTGTPAAVPPSPGRLVVTAFGAQGNGIANDSPAIQAAVDAAQPGDHVYFPSGTYHLDTAILIRKGSLMLEGDGAGSVIQHGAHDGFQLGAGGDMLTQLEIDGLRFVGLPGQYQADGNAGAALKIAGAQAAFIHDCEFDGPGIAIWDAGDPGTTAGTHLLNCHVNSWGSSAFVLTGGERVESCSLTQDDPDRTGSHSGSAILLHSGCTDVQITSVTVANARSFAVQVGEDGVNALTAGIQIQGLTAQSCRAGILIDGGGANPAPVRDLLVDQCALLGTYDGAGIWVKQGDGVVITRSTIDGGTVGLALGLWPAGAAGSVMNVQVGSNTVRNCDRGIWAQAANGGTVANVSLEGNSVVNCRVPLDLAGAPGVSLSSSPSSGGPTVTWLADGLQEPITNVIAGHHFLIRGSGFGANSSDSSRVLFFAGGATVAGVTFQWDDGTIGVVAPSYSGLVEVAVQVEVDGTLVTSNLMPVVVQ